MSSHFSVKNLKKNLWLVSKRLRNNFVGGGATKIAESDLTDANIDLEGILDAIENGIMMFPILGFDGIHSYFNYMSSPNLNLIIIRIENLGVKENPNFRKSSSYQA